MTGFPYLAEPEERVTNEKTGGQKGKKLTQVGALDPISLIELARVAGMGANKYSAYNFMKGTDWSLMFNAAQRHLLRMWAGEDKDPESGLLHAAHAAWMCLALVSYQLRAAGTDDRPSIEGMIGEEGVACDVPGPEVTFRGMPMNDWLGYEGPVALVPDFHGTDTVSWDVNTCCGYFKGEHSIQCPQFHSGG